MQYRFKAFMKDPDADRPDNPIHSTQGGREHGFRGALIGGIHVYGWTTGAFVNSYGEDWVDTGWAEVSFKRPTYDGDNMCVNLNGSDFTVTNNASEVCLEGRAGLGEAPFFRELTVSEWRPSVEPIQGAPALTLSNAPVGQTLAPMSVPFSLTDHEEFIREKLGDASTLYSGDKPRCHPAFIAGRPIYLLHHSFHYGPAIHTNTQIQNLAPAYAGETLTVTGTCVDAFERNGHHYIVNDASVYSEGKQELARLRHSAIFKLRTA